MHIIVVASLTILMGLFGMSILGWLAGSAFYLGREVSQAEYRWMAAAGKNRTEMPWYEGFKIWKWCDKSIWLDLVIPAVVGMIIVFLM